MATDPLASTFGGWQAVENAALALTDAANLLSIPGLQILHDSIGSQESIHAMRAGENSPIYGLITFTTK